MSENNVNIHDDENEDIYKDIGDFHFDKELAKLEETSQAYREEIANLSVKLKEITEKNIELQNVNEILSTNISILLKTARAEIDRKQALIDNFRKKIESQNRRYMDGETNNADSFRICKNCEKKLPKDNLNDVEDGEKAENDFADNDVSSERKRRRGSDKRYHSGNHRKKKESPKNSRTRSHDRYSSRRNSRYSDEIDSHPPSSSRNHVKCNSPDRKRHSDRRTRSSDGSKYSKRSEHSRSSRNRRSQNSPDRKSREWRELSSKKEPSTHGKNISKEREPVPTAKREKNSRGTVESALKSCKFDESKVISAKVHDTRTGNVEIEKSETENNGKCDIVNKLNIVECKERGKINCNNVQNITESDSLTRDSVLADLYAPCTLTEVPSEIKGKSLVTTVNENEAEDCNSWFSNDMYMQSTSKKSETVKTPRTLYSRRMEAKLQQMVRENVSTHEHLDDRRNKKSAGEDKEYIPEDKKKNVVNTAKEEKEEGEITSEADENDKESENLKERSCTEGHEKNGVIHGIARSVEENSLEWHAKGSEKKADQPLGEELIQKLLDLQNSVENPGIVEFSPLKNNYKLTKISPQKSVSKQHILDYYNLKPSLQQLNNIESEILDFSLTLPETPGKNFTHPFTITSEDQEPGEEKEKGIASNEDSECSKTDINEKTIDRPRESSVEEGEIRSNKDEEIEKNNALINIPDEGKIKKSDASTSFKGRYGEKKQNNSYRIRTRSKTESEKLKWNNVTDFFKKKCDVSVKSVSQEKSGTKRKRNPVSSDEETSFTPKQKNEMKNGKKKKKTSKKEMEVKEECKNEEINKVDGDASDVFKSAPNETPEVPSEKVEGKDGSAFELSLSNGGNSRLSESVEEKEKLSFSKGKSPNSSFRVLRSYLMLSANDDSDSEDFSECSTSGEYSDSGASALVDLL